MTNTGPTAVYGDIGVAPGAAITGLGSMTLVGGLHLADATAQRAHADAAGAFDDLGAMAVGHDLSGRNPGGLVLTAGVNRYASEAQLTGTLTLDVTGAADRIFVFQIGSARTAGTVAAVNVIGGGSSSRIYWRITLDTGSSILFGRALAVKGAVTLDCNLVSIADTEGPYGLGHTDFGSLGFSGAGAVPEPTTWTLLLFGLGGARGAVRRARRDGRPGRTAAVHARF